MKSKWFRRVLIVLALIALGVIFRYTVFRADPVEITVFRVAEGRVEDTVTNSKAGTVKTRRRAALSPEIGGRVEALSAREGDRVSKGQLLMRISDDDYRAQVDLSKQALEASRAREREACLAADQAERDLDRYVHLAAEEIVSAEILDQVRSRRDGSVARCDAARSGVDQATAALQVARVNLAKTSLRAPFDGVVTEVSTELGEWITPSPPGLPIPPVIEILDPAAIYIEAPLDEVDVGKVEVGLPVRITLDAFPDQAFMGTLSRVAPFVRDELDQNRTFDVEVEFDDGDFAATLLPGASADVEVILDARDDVLRIPSYALMEGSQVLVVRDDELVAVPVEAGLRNWEFTEITRGLQADDPVVVSLDRLEVQEGARVRITDETLK
jgi:HlyD family secretion protein